MAYPRLLLLLLPYFDTRAKGRLVATLNFEPLLLRAVIEERAEYDRLQAEQAGPRDKLPLAALTAVVRSIAGNFPGPKNVTQRKREEKIESRRNKTIKEAKIAFKI